MNSEVSAAAGHVSGERKTDATVIGSSEEPDNGIVGEVKNYRSVDDAILHAQGHEAVLKRSFSFLSSLGLAFDITNSWVGVLSNFGQYLQYGGAPLAVWSVLIACFVQWTITLGLSELASAFPSSGGQYHFVYIVASPKTRRFCAFVTGWMSIFGWWFGTCSGLSLVANSILGLATFLHPNYVAQQWHVYVVYLAMIIVTVVPLFVFPKWLPRLSTGALGFTVVGFFTWFIVILSMRTHTNSADFIISGGQGTSGWNPGTAWVLGIINSMYAFTGTDGAIHIASHHGWPAGELLYQVTGNKAVTVALTVVLTMIYVYNIPPQWIASGRLAWAFARDNGLPYSEYFSHVDPVLEFPVRTTMAAYIFSSIYGLIYLASTSAFNSIITSAILFLNISYAIPQAVVAFRGRSKTLINRPLSLGPACATCREKSRRCDRGRPSCGRCITKGYHCGGYPDKFRFCGLASRGKWKGREAPTLDRPKRRRRNDNQREPTTPIQQITIVEEQAIAGTPQLVGLHDDDDPGVSNANTPAIYHQQSSVSESTDLNDDSEVLGPSPVPASLTSDDPSSIDSILVSEETEMLLAHYDRVICPHQIAPYADSKENPYRTYVLPLAYENIGLLHAVLSLSACHLGHLKMNKHLYESVAVNCRIQAITALGATIRQGYFIDDEERDSVFATIQILLLYDICESGISEHGAHISGAMSICSQLKLSQSLRANDKRTIFFLGNLVWLDIVRAFSAPEKLCFTQDLRERFVLLGDANFEAVNGCPRDLVLLIGELLELAKAHACGGLGVERYVQGLHKSIQKLYIWDSSTCHYPDNNPHWVLVGESFRHTCILRALRLLDITEPAEMPRIQYSVTEILNAISKIPRDSPLIELLILPLFMAGVDCIFPYSQHYALMRIDEIKARSEMSNATTVHLLKKVWQEREKKKSHTNANVSWMSFTRNSDLNQQHDYLII